MAAPPPPRPTGSAYEVTTAYLSRASTPLPTMVVLDADHVLWPVSSTQLSEEVQLYPDVQGVLSGLHAAGIKLGVIGTGDCTQQASLQAAIDRGGLQGIIDHLHVHQTDAADDNAPPSQAEVEAHWRDHRLASGVPWSNCIALVGSASSLRAANRAGAAAVLLLRTGLTPDVLANALEIWASKSEGDRGF